MRTIKAKFSGGGHLNAVYETNMRPVLFEAEGLPGLNTEDLSEGAPGGLELRLQQHAEATGQTVDIEDDKGETRFMTR